MRPGRFARGLSGEPRNLRKFNQILAIFGHHEPIPDKVPERNHYLGIDASLLKLYAALKRGIFLRRKPLRRLALPPSAAAKIGARGCGFASAIHQNPKKRLHNETKIKHYRLSACG